MREASQRGRRKGGSAYAECMEPALESCMNPMVLVLHVGKPVHAIFLEICTGFSGVGASQEKVQRMPALTV